MAGLGRLQVDSAVAIDQAERVRMREGHAAPALPDRPGCHARPCLLNRHGMDQIGRECETAVQRKDIDHRPRPFYETMSDTAKHEILKSTHDELSTRRIRTTIKALGRCPGARARIQASKSLSSHGSDRCTGTARAWRHSPHDNLRITRFLVMNGM